MARSPLPNRCCPTASSRSSRRTADLCRRARTGRSCGPCVDDHDHPGQCGVPAGGGLGRTRPRSPIRGSTTSTPCCASSTANRPNGSKAGRRRLGGLHGDRRPGADLPDWRPGCGSWCRSQSFRQLAVRFSGSTIRSRRVEIAALEDEWEALYDQDWSDGLPVVSPTEARVFGCSSHTPPTRSWPSCHRTSPT